MSAPLKISSSTISPAGERGTLALAASPAHTLSHHINAVLTSDNVASDDGLGGKLGAHSTYGLHKRLRVAVGDVQAHELQGGHCLHHLRHRARAARATRGDQGTGTLRATAGAPHAPHTAG